MIRHVVALRFREGVEAPEKAVIFEELAALEHVVDGALDFQIRANVSPEEAVVRGFRDLFWFDFRDAVARDIYLEHPDHKAAGARLVAALEGGIDGVFVMDFEV